MDPQQQFRSRVFISYSHFDGKCAKWLHQALETYRMPKRLGTAHRIFALIVDDRRPCDGSATRAPGHDDIDSC